MKLLNYQEWITSPNQIDGISSEVEKEIRCDIVYFMLLYGKMMDIRTESLSKATYIFHAFSHKYSFKKFDRYCFAAASVYLATKIDDPPVMLERAARSFCFLNLLRKSGELNYNLTIDSSHKKKMDSIEKPQIDSHREKISDAEFHLLNFLGFDLEIELPYYYLDKFENSNYFKGLILCEKKDVWIIAIKKFINDSFLTNVCLHFEPKLITLAAILYCQSLFAENLPQITDNKEWFQIFDNETNLEDLKEITKHLNYLFNY